MGDKFNVRVVKKYIVVIFKISDEFKKINKLFSAIKTMR